MSQVRVVKVFTETNSSTTNADGKTSTASFADDRADRKEYHSVTELPADTKKYIDDLLGPDASMKFDKISVVSEQSTRHAQPDVRVVNISHKKVVEENRQIPVMDERTMKTSTQETSTQHQTTQISSPQQTQIKEETKTFSKDMLDQLPEECKKYVNDFMQTQGMQNKNIEHVTVHTTRENTTTNANQNDIPDLQVKNCLQSHDKIVVEIDAAGFLAEDISMKVSGRNLIIQGRKEGPDPRDPATTLRKELKRDIVMPPGVDAAHITCSLNSDTGRLTVTIPFPQPTGGEYTIPINTV